MTDDPDNMAQANARPEVGSAAIMTNAAEDLDTGKHEPTQHSQDTFNKRRKLDIDTPANQQDELEAAKQALLRRLFGPEPTTQSSADVTTASATGEPHDTVRGSTVVEPERGHSLPENVEDPDARSHDSDDKPAPAVDGTTATMGGNKDSEAKEAPPLSNSQAPPASDSSSTAKSQITSASTTLTTPRLEETAPPYPFRNGYSRVLQSQRKAMWSPDGKCILTTCSDLCLRTHVLFRNEPPPSVYVGVYEAPSTIASFTPAPWFDTEEADTMHVVVSVQDHPIRLFNINDPDSKTVQAYSLMSETDDVQFIKAASMKFKPDGRQFVCGGLNSVAIFDINRERPVAHLHTHHNSKRKNKLDPYALSGSILSLDYRHDGVLAVGTTSSKIGFYTNYGEGEAIISENFSTKSAGEGIDALRWSPDGNYLYVSQKRSNVINILDIRFSTRRLASLTNRPGNTTQSLSIDLKLHDNGYHVIAGGTDGVVRAWENPFTRSESSIRPDLEWKAHDDIVANAVANPVYQDYLVTTAGSDKFPTEDEYDTSDDDEDSERIVAKKRGRSEEERVPDAPVLPGWMKIWSFMT